MSVGESTTHAHAILNILRGTAAAGITPYVQLHTGDPGAAGTANQSATTARQQVSFAAPAAGSMTAPAVTWSNWAAGTETISHVSLWDASTGGGFRKSAALDASKTIENGDSLNVTLTATQGPIAA